MIKALKVKRSKKEKLKIAASVAATAILFTLAVGVAYVQATILGYDDGYDKGYGNGHDDGVSSILNDPSALGRALQSLNKH